MPVSVAGGGARAVRTTRDGRGVLRGRDDGLRYSVPVLSDGLNGETNEVITGWIVEHEGAAPRLTTAYVNVP